MSEQQAQFAGVKSELIRTTIGQHLNAVTAKNPDHMALIMSHQDIRWSYAEFLHAVDRLAMGLLALGLEPGDRVGIWSPNRVEWVLTQFATAKIGAIMVCINPAYRLYELEYALNKVGCTALITRIVILKRIYSEFQKYPNWAFFELESLNDSLSVVVGQCLNS